MSKILNSAVEMINGLQMSNRLSKLAKEFEEQGKTVEWETETVFIVDGKERFALVREINSKQFMITHQKKKFLVGGWTTHKRYNFTK